MRARLLDYITNNLAGSIKTSQELPWDQGGAPLYKKNLKRVYLDEPQIEQSVLQAVIDGNDVMQVQTTIKGYLTVDAKNKSGDLDAALSVLVNARTQSGITESFRNEFDYVTEIDQGQITYNFEYRFFTVA